MKNQNELFKRFKDSHKRLTSFDDIMEHAGNLENALYGHSLGGLAAVHAYEGGSYIIEATMQGGLEPFSLELCNESWCAATLEELEPKLFEWWADEVHPFLDATDLPYLGQGRYQAFGEVSDNDPPDEERDGTFGGWTTCGETEDDERSNGPTIS